MKSLLTIFAIGATALVAASPATAQTPADCKGTLEVIRFSQLKPGKTIDDMRKIGEAQMGWYRAHGYKNNRQVVAPVLTIAGVVPDQVVTIHINAPGVKSEEHDAAWDDFADAYRKTSTVQAMRTVCLPKYVYVTRT